MALGNETVYEVQDLTAGSSDIALKPQTATPVSAVVTVVIAISDSKHSEYAFDWALKYFIPQGAKVALITVQPTEAYDEGYYYTAGLAARGGKERAEGTNIW